MSDRPETLWGFPIVYNDRAPLEGSIVVAPFYFPACIKIRAPREAFAEACKNFWGVPPPGTSFGIENRPEFEGYRLVVIFAEVEEENFEYLILYCHKRKVE